MKRIITIVLIMAIAIMSTSYTFAETTEYNTLDKSVVLTHLGSDDIIEIKGAPAGVVFGPETYATGSYEIQGVIISVAAGALSIAIGLPELYSAIVLAISTALSVGASHIYWIKWIAYGEDANYYYTRTRIRFYSNPARTNPVSDWQTVYHKKSKNSGANTGGDGE